MPRRAYRLLCHHPRNLRSLLWYRGTVGVLAKIRGIVELAGSSLDTVPDLSGRRRGVLLSNSRVNSGTELADSVLHVSALRKTSTEEGSVKGQQDPRSALEQDGGQEKTGPEKDLQTRHDSHGGVVIGLHEVTNGICDRAAGLGARSSTLDRRDSGDNVGASVSCDVENGVDSVWQKGKGVLGSDKPDKGHGCESQLRHSGNK